MRQVYTFPGNIHCIVCSLILYVPSQASSLNYVLMHTTFFHNMTIIMNVPSNSLFLNDLSIFICELFKNYVISSIIQDDWPEGYQLAAAMNFKFMQMVCYSVLLICVFFAKMIFHLII